MTITEKLKESIRGMSEKSKKAKIEKLLWEIDRANMEYLDAQYYAYTRVSSLNGFFITRLLKGDINLMDRDEKTLKEILNFYNNIIKIYDKV